MFGEYALYNEGKVVALVCENKLFLKPTKTGRTLISSPHEAPAYPGARLSFLIEEELDDRERLAELIRVTTEELPLPKPKKQPKKKPKSLL